MNPAQLKSYINHMLVVIVVVAVDQISKQMALQYLSGGHTIKLLDVLQLALVFNKGAAFGMLSQAGGWQYYFLATLALIISVVLLVWIWRVCLENRQLSIALVLVLGGAIGNLIDRVMYQFVVDFILLHYRQYQFWVFNIADSAITIGALLLIADAFGWRLLGGAVNNKTEDENG